MEIDHLLKYPDSPGILLSHFSPEVLMKPLMLPTICPDSSASGLLKKVELEMEEAPWNLLRFCLRVTLLTREIVTQLCCP